jgi:hypothetical protein
MSMNLWRNPREGARSLERLDTLMDSYLNWRDQSRAVADEYLRWTLAPRSERSIAFERYLAALDLEEFAACGYRRFVEHPQARGGAPVPEVARAPAP